MENVNGLQYLICPPGGDAAPQKTSSSFGLILNSILLKHFEDFC